MLIKFYERGMIMKIKKLDRSRKILLSVVLMITLVCGVIFYTVQKPEVTLATEVKLRTYDTLNQNEPMKESVRDTAETSLLPILIWKVPIARYIQISEKIWMD